MKKYFYPTTETVEIETIWALCEGSDPNGDAITTSPSDRDAPRRRVF
jgi:hypothetical protein